MKNAKKSDKQGGAAAVSEAGKEKTCETSLSTEARRFLFQDKCFPLDQT